MDRAGSMMRKMSGAYRVLFGRKKTNWEIEV
jgi:hypothetical protein